MRWRTCQAGREEQPAPLFSTQLLHHTPLAAARLSQGHEQRFTHPFSNFFILIPASTPSSPQWCAQRSTPDLLRDVGPVAGTSHVHLTVLRVCVRPIAVDRMNEVDRIGFRVVSSYRKVEVSAHSQCLVRAVCKSTFRPQIAVAPFRHMASICHVGSACPSL